MIDKTTLINRLTQSKETKDYTYAILFLLISSFFAFAVIRPVITIAVSLDREAKDLRVTNDVFEKNITSIVSLQNQMQEIRPQTFLVDLALPPNPQLQALIADIRTVALNEGIKVVNIEMKELQNEKTAKQKSSRSRIIPTFHKPIVMNIALKADFYSPFPFSQLLIN